MSLGFSRHAAATWALLLGVLVLGVPGCGQPGASSKAEHVIDLAFGDLSQRFVAIPAQVAVGVEFVQRSETRPVPPALVEAYRSAVAAAYTPARLETALREKGPANAAASIPEKVRTAMQRLRDAQGVRGAPSARQASPAGSTIMHLAAALPDTRLREEEGVAAYRAAYVVNGYVRPVPPQLAAYTAAHLTETVDELVRVSRASAQTDEAFPGVPRARRLALADNIAALGRLSAADVAILDGYYASPGARTAVDAEVSAFARANDTAAAAALREFLSKVAALPARS